MKIEKDAIKIISFALLTSFLWINASFAESLQCPQIDFDIKRSSLLSPGWLSCDYKKDLGINARWNIPKSMDDCEKVLHRQELYGGIVNFVNVWETGKTFTLYSETYPASVSIKLNRKEFSEKRRPYWMNIAREFLKKVEQKTINCEGLKFKKEQPKSTTQAGQYPNKTEIKKQTDSPRKVTPPSSTDSWDAPSPKAKIPE